MVWFCLQWAEFQPSELEVQMEMERLVIQEFALQQQSRDRQQVDILMLEGQNTGRNTNQSNWKEVRYFVANQPEAGATRTPAVAPAAPLPAQIAPQVGLHLLFNKMVEQLVSISECTIVHLQNMKLNKMVYSQLAIDHFLLTLMLFSK